MEMFHKRDMPIGKGLALSGMMIAAGLLALLPGCGESPQAQDQRPKKVLVQVEVLEIRPETFQETMVVSGVAKAKVEYRISTQVSGMLKAQHVDRGERVKEGMVLFEIDPEEFQLHVRERVANFNRGQARLKFMEQELERKDALFKDGILSPTQWDRLQFDLATARAERDQARVALEQAERDLGLTTVRSPITGIILERYHEAGEVISRGTILAWIVDTSRVIFEIGLSDRELTNVHEEDRGDVRVDALPDKAFKGEVTRISGNADPGTGSFPVEVTVVNPGFEILPGMVGRIDLPGVIHRDRIIIPLMAVRKQLEGTMVYVVEDGRAVRRPVMLGKVLGDRVVVHDGLKPGDRLVVVGQGKLEPGDTVEVIRELPVS